MATKPGTVPAIWSPSANYTTGPFIGQPTKVLPGGAVAVDGHRPGAADPTPAEYQNYQQHWETRWIVDWLSQGLATPAANTHIVETDANGRTELIGLDLTDPTDQPLGTWTTAHTGAVAITLTTAGATGFQVNVAGAGAACYDADLSPAGGGLGFTAVDSAASTATAYNCLLQGGGRLCNYLGSGATTQGGLMRLTASNDDTLYLLNSGGGGGAGLRLDVQTPPGVLRTGQIWPDGLNDDLEFVSPSGSQQRLWSSEQGYDITFSETAIAAAAGGTYLSFNFGFVTGKRYIIKYGFDFGRTVGSSRHAIDFFNIGGVYFPTWFAAQLDLFQGGPAQIERSRMKEWVFTSPVTGILLVDLFIGQTAGAGTVQIENGFISVIAALD